MLIKLTTLIFTLFLITAHAQEIKKKVENQRTDSAEESLSLYDFITLQKDPISGEVYSKSKEQIQYNSQEHENYIQFDSEAMGGDVVGNGGGEIYQKLIEQYNTLPITKFNLPDISELNIKIVDDLTIHNSKRLFVVTTENLIFDRAMLEKHMQVQTDFRHFFLEIISQHFNSIESSQVLELYNSLEPLADFQPYCNYDLHETSFETEIQRSSAKSKLSLIDAQNMALRSCQSKNLNECTLSESGQRGIFGSKHFFATATGFELILTEADDEQLEGQLCKKLKACETLHTLAPIGQLSFGHFSKLEKNIRNFCF
ncbi:MAG: hypothetical protein CME62_07960 [Halobacteriovoraceae bacterium]|nr:hypothetical protein [Halobacteriovoraceae bacterium]|tara:strand:+ start:9577 stop:10518 length:942 start_codon:yes stop_codon:yes gene_type:complete